MGRTRRIPTFGRHAGGLPPAYNVCYDKSIETARQDATMPDQNEIQIGKPAPDFVLPCSTGEPIRLSDFRGKSEVVLFFYPKDNSPACTAQACSFRDHYEAFRDAGAEVIGISSDSEASHERFARFWKLPFFLVSDDKGEVRARYGVSRTLGLFPGRVTYLIDREGVIRHIFSSQFQPGRHVSEMLEALRKMRTNRGYHAEVSPSP